MVKDNFYFKLYAKFGKHLFSVICIFFLRFILKNKNFEMKKISILMVLYQSESKSVKEIQKIFKFAKVFLLDKM